MEVGDCPDICRTPETSTEKRKKRYGTDLDLCITVYNLPMDIFVTGGNQNNLRTMVQKPRQ